MSLSFLTVITAVCTVQLKLHLLQGGGYGGDQSGGMGGNQGGGGGYGGKPPVTDPALSCCHTVPTLQPITRQFWDVRSSAADTALACPPERFWNVIR